MERIYGREASRLYRPSKATMPKKTTKKKEDSAIEDAIAVIRGKYGEDAIMKIDGVTAKNVEVIKSGSIGLDYALGVGGYPRGRIVEIFGPESSGKTTMALHAIAEAQKAGGVCAFVDAENALDIQYAQKLGVNTKELLLSQPNGGEEAMNITNDLVRTGKIDMIVIDSVAALTPRAEIEGDIGDLKIGAQARLMSQALRVMTAAVREHKVVVIFINQIRINIGGYGNPETTAGGKALKFFTSIRVDIRKIATIKKGEEAVGSRVRAKVVKNKVASPFRLTEFDVIYNEGISREGELLALGEKKKVISKSSGAIYTFGEEKLGRGYDATRQFLRANPEVSERLYKAIFEGEIEEVATPEDGIMEEGREAD